MDLDVVDGGEDAFAEVVGGSLSRSSTASCSPVEAPEGTAARPLDAVGEDDVGLDGGIASGVEDFAGVDGDDLGHGAPVSGVVRRCLGVGEDDAVGEAVVETGAAVDG